MKNMGYVSFEDENKNKRYVKFYISVNFRGVELIQKGYILRNLQKVVGGQLSENDFY